MILVGYEHLNYLSKKSNTQVDGYRIHVTDEITSNGSGVRCSSYWVKTSVFEESKLTVGSKIEVYFDAYRNVQKLLRA